MTLAVTLCTVQVFFFFFTDIIQCKQNMHMFWVSALLTFFFFFFPECKLCVLNKVWCLEWVTHSGIIWINCAQTFSGCASEYLMGYRLYIDLAFVRKALFLLSQLIRLLAFACLPQLALIMIWSGCHEIFFSLLGEKSRIKILKHTHIIVSTERNDPRTKNKKNSWTIMYNQQVSKTVEYNCL